MIGPVRSVYVHAPFCARRCPYCDFAVTVRRTPDAADWLGAIRAELEAVQQREGVTLPDVWDTVYVGGGTPSLLGGEVMSGLSDVLGRNRLRGVDIEWTAEANPESFTPEVAAAWRASGVNRLSLGVQTFHESSLRWMGRMHGPDGARKAVRVAREKGFESVSVDLIFALPDRLDRSWPADLDEVIALDVPHVSLYGLTFEEGTPLGRALREGRERPPDDDRYEDEYLMAVERLEEAGYRHYEVSNFAREGFESRHNRVYWSGRPYLGLGNGAHGYFPPERRWNVRDWEEFRAAVTGGRSAVAGRERLDEEALRLERVWLGLRTEEGIELRGLTPEEREVARRWRRRGLAVDDEDALALTARGWLLLDELALELVGAAAPAGRHGFARPVA